jgi:hypothetical protein
MAKVRLLSREASTSQYIAPPGVAELEQGMNQRGSVVPGGLEK